MTVWRSGVTAVVLSRLLTVYHAWLLHTVAGSAAV
jgi:hypothetical protein